MDGQIDNLIVSSIENEFKSVKEISTELSLPYVRVAVRIKQLRKRNQIIMLQTNMEHIKGVKPIKYKKIKHKT